MKRWPQISLVNLLVLSLLGVALRYKVAFPLPFINYKYLLNAHSHFAFTGWVTTVIYTSLLFMLNQSGVRISTTYQRLFLLNQVSAYGMLVSFLWQGYGPVSIAFLSLSVLVSYGFTILYWVDLGRAGWPKVEVYSIRLALIFLALSSAGPYLLAYSMSHNVGDMAFYYNAFYLFLHFQYNGWFSFAAIGVFLWMCRLYGWAIPTKSAYWLVGLMGAACIPAYCLSLLWTDPPGWVRGVAAAAGVMQVAALGILCRTVWSLRRNATFASMPRPVRSLWMVAGLAFAIKIVLQGLSVIPVLGRLAFGFRPVIIAYLHLVLLGFVSVFFIGFLIGAKLVKFSTRPARVGLWGFISGVVLNEILLLVQSLLGLTGHGWGAAVYSLLGAAIWMAAAAFMLQRRSSVGSG